MAWWETDDGYGDLFHDGEPSHQYDTDLWQAVPGTRTRLPSEEAQQQDGEDVEYVEDVDLNGPNGWKRRS